MSRFCVRAILAVVIGGLPVFQVDARQTAALDLLIESRRLYEAAEYDRALAAMETIDQSSMSADQVRDRAVYQALCLLALDLRPQAEARLESVLRVDATFQPPEDASPRLRELFAAVRSRVQPDLAREHYLAGKALFERRQYGAALKELTLATQLTKDGQGAVIASLSDLETLAGGFRELAERAIAAAAAARSVSSAAPKLVPPTVLYQELPAWPRDLVVRPGQMTGTLDIVVSATGEVGSVRLVKSIHPMYDTMLLAAAKRWRYKPATRDGKPVAFVRQLTVNVNAR